MKKEVFMNKNSYWLLCIHILQLLWKFLGFCWAEDEIGLIFLILNMIMKEVYRSDVCFGGRDPQTGDFHGDCSDSLGTVFVAALCDSDTTWPPFISMV